MTAKHLCVCLAADNNTYSSCASSSPCRVRSELVAATFHPGPENATQDTLLQLISGIHVTMPGNETGLGALTSSGSTTPYITLEIDGADAGSVEGVTLWPQSDSIEATTRGSNLTIWLHTLADFSADPNPIKCAEKLSLVARLGTFVQCAPGTNSSSIRYVTIQRFSSSSVQLGLQQVAVYHAGELHAVYLPALALASVLQKRLGHRCG